MKLLELYLFGVIIAFIVSKIIVGFIDKLPEPARTGYKTKLPDNNYIIMGISLLSWVIIAAMVIGFIVGFVRSIFTSKKTK